MTGLPITLTFTFDDMAQAAAFLTGVRRTKESHAKASEDNGRTSGTGAAPVTGDASRPNVGGGTDEADRDAGHMPTCALTPRDALTVGTVPQMDGGGIAAVKGQARPASVVDAEPSPSSTPNPFIAIRPNCQKPEHCSGYGRNHCHACKVTAAAEAEAA